MENHSMVWVGMDTDANKNQIWLYRDWDREPAAEWEAGMDSQGIKKLIERLHREKAEIRCVYEAGPCGYELYRKLKKVGIHCDVIAPSLTPQRPGDRVKTNRRDARNLARLYRAGELTVIDVPDEKQEALRDLTRAREDVREDLTRRQHRLNRFLARQGCHYQDGEKWTQKHWAWIRKIRLEDSNAETVREESIRAVEQSQEQLKTYDAKIEENAGKPEYAKKVERYQTLRGVSTVTSMTIVAEVWDMRRYGTAPQFMGSTGLVSSERSTGDHERRGKITKAGNAHLRRVLVGSGLALSSSCERRQNDQEATPGTTAAVVSIAERADQRLNRK